VTDLRGKILVDSSIWIAVLRHPDEDLSPRITELVANGGATITGMIRLEVLRGARTEQTFARLVSMFEAFDEISPTASTWEEAARLGMLLRRRGAIVPATDLLIAAIALQSGCILLHRDAHFDAIAAHSSLQVESYSRP
jgi:predicted nucleic acid-binding protein